VAKLTVTANEAALAHAAAERLTACIDDAIAQRGGAVVSLTGGRTPRTLYAVLADEKQPWRHRIDWPHVHLFWGDERHVPPGHPDSNFGMANDALIRHVPIPAAQVHRMRGELPDARDAAAEYRRSLARGFAAAGRNDSTFDVMLLGLGEDGHIASIFPGSPLLIDGHQADVSRVAAVWAEHLGAWRITLTPAAILDARQIVMVVSGRQKADAVRAAVGDPGDVRRTPAQLLRAAGERVEWILDRAAASRLADPSNAT
jgi:6-phosphogluconolactonase